MAGVGHRGFSHRGAREGAEDAMRVVLLGRFEVSVGLRVVREDGWRLRKAASLVKLLALTPGHRLHREQVMEGLWPGLPAKSAANNLYQALHVARRTLAAGEDPRFLALRGEWVVLGPSAPSGRLWVDAEAFEAAARAARRSRDPAAHESALALYSGDLLPDDRYEDWAEGRRRELRDLRVALLVDLAGLYEGRGEPRRAIRALEEAVAGEPTHEEAHVGLMRLYTATGRRFDAIRRHEKLRETLRDELGIEPGPETGRVLEEILAGDVPALKGPPAPAHADVEPAEGKHNLPGSLTSFVGRGREKAEVERLLGASRLLTLTGMGGSGKTRLAREVAGALASSHPDGVWLVELAPLSDGTLVAGAVAGAIGVREEPGRPLVATLVGALRDRRALLVLDNCEHLVEAVASLAEALLSACPALRVLATSREPLGARGEATFPVPPLPCPEPGRRYDPEALRDFEAVRLFVDRARSRDPDFGLTPENAAAVAEVCARLEGLPLAIELAAARVGLSVQEVSTRLDDALKLLTGGARTAAPRQRTLRGALDWSHGLLSDPEKALFRRLSVFAGGWTLEAAEEVCPGDGIGRDDVLDLFGGLLDKSLVVAGTGGAGGARFRFLEPVRQYAREKLEESGEAGETARRHAAYHLALSERAQPGLTGPEQAMWLDLLQAEHPNLRAALGWLLERGDDDAALRLAAAVWLFWYTRGHLREGRACLERLIARTEGVVSRARAEALKGAGWISMFEGDYGAARKFFEEGLSLFRKLGDEDGTVTCLTNLGLTAVLGELADVPVPALLEEATSLMPRLTNPRTIANVLILSGLVAFAGGDVQRSWELHEEALEISRRVRDARGICVCLTNLGLMAVGRSDTARATALLRENLRLARDTDDKMPIQYALFGLAGVAASLGLPARAARLWAASESVREAANIDLSPLARAGTNHDAALSAVRARLGDAAFDVAWAEGKTMSQNEAVEYALDEGETAPPATPDEPTPSGRPTAT